MVRIAALLAAVAFTACGSEHFETSYRADARDESDPRGPRGERTRAPNVIIDVGVLCPDDQLLAVELMVEGRLLQHEIFDAFEPCEAPRLDVRPWPGMDP